MIPDQPYIRNVEFGKDIDSPFVFLFHSEFGVVSSVNDEVYAVFFPVDVFYEIICFVITALCVAHQDEPDRVFVFCGSFNKRDILFVDITLGYRKSPVIWVIVDQVTRRQ